MDFKDTSFMSKMYEANLSIYCVDGGTVYGCISGNLKVLNDFLKRYDHEGSTIDLHVRKDPDTFVEFSDPEAIYRYLSQEVDLNNGA